MMHSDKVLCHMSIFYSEAKSWIKTDYAVDFATSVYHLFSKHKVELISEAGMMFMRYASVTIHDWQLDL